MAHSRRSARRQLDQGVLGDLPEFLAEPGETPRRPGKWRAAAPALALLIVAAVGASWWFTAGRTQTAAASEANGAVDPVAAVVAEAATVAAAPTPTATPEPTPQPTATPEPQLATLAEPAPTPTVTVTPTPAPSPTPNPYARIAAIQSDVGPDAEPVYLTIDDGPEPEYTTPMLDILDEFNAKATFFVLGIKARDHPELIAEIVARGHVVANHTWAHGNQVRQSDEAIIGSLASTTEAIINAGAPAPICFRPPYGSTNQRTRGVVAGQGYTLHMWDANGLDYERSDRDSVARSILGTVQPGDRVLLHDGGGNRSGTVEALRDVLEVLTSHGVTFAALPDCVSDE